MLTIGVLGPLEVSVDGQPAEPTAGRLRTLLAVLAMSAGKTVSVDRMAAALWDEEQPDNARRGIQTYVTRLRGVLGASVISTEPAGYLLRAEPGQIDALRFGQLLEAAARASDPTAERALLDEALMLWRGDPFDGLRSDWLVRTETPRLVERRLSAIERRIDLALADGRPGELVAELHELTAEYPLRESLWVRLLVVLDRVARQAEALERYETIRVRLAEELGTDPGPELQRAHTELLAGRPPVPLPAPARLVPRQLPTDVDGFVGRASALKALDAFVDEMDGRAERAVIIAAVAGTAGVGKTALAVHWAHRVADRFPDGQLYVNLRGFHQSGQLMTSADAVRGFLDALEVPSHRIPSQVDARAALYRSLLAGKRMLVVLDNARDAEQVRPLLPGSATCLVVVTSRSQLTGLVVAEAARPLVLDLLSIEEARQLLVGRLGADRVAAEEAATDAIIDRCARLPLALAIAAARAATHPDFPLSTVAAELGDALDALSGGEAAIDARAIFSWSYRALPADAARLFRLLGLHPGPDLSAAAAASLAGVPVAQVRGLLADLCRAHLLSEHLPGRYVFHDLLRAYAAELASDGESRSARHRLFDHYLHTGWAAARVLNPHREPIAVAPLRPGVTPEGFIDHERAQDWYAAEHAVLLAILHHAAGMGFDSHVWQVAWSMEDFLYRCGYWQDWWDTQNIALEAARRQADDRGQAMSHRGLGNTHVRLGRHVEALPHLQQALELFIRLDDPAGQAHTHLGFSSAYGGLDRLGEAKSHRDQALGLYVASGDRLGQARVLNTNGWYHAQRGEYQRALEHCQRALVLFQEVGERTGEGYTLDSLGYVHLRLGDHRQAITSYQRAIALFDQIGLPYFLAESLVNLGDAHLAAGEPDAARPAWRRAVAIFDEAGQPEAEPVRERLAGLD